jgi:hypothetical protein
VSAGKTESKSLQSVGETTEEMEGREREGEGREREVMR